MNSFQFPEQELYTLLSHAQQKQNECLLGRFKHPEGISLQVVMDTVPSDETLTIRVEYERYFYDCGRNYITAEFKTDSLKTRQEQITHLFEQFFEWKKNVCSDSYHMFNRHLISKEVYHAKLKLAEFISGTSNDICYICHEPCLYYENLRSCQHPIHRFCAVLMCDPFSKNYCGICKKDIHKPVCSFEYCDCHDDSDSDDE
jgi:hypothetical protein